MNHFRIDSGLGGCFNFFIDIFVKKVFLIFVVAVTVGITNYITIIIILTNN